MRAVSRKGDDLHAGGVQGRGPVPRHAAAGQDIPSEEAGEPKKRENRSAAGRAGQMDGMKGEKTT